MQLGSTRVRISAQVWSIIDGWASRGRKEKSSAVLRPTDIQYPEVQALKSLGYIK
jgi:hypothetical protein